MNDNALAQIDPPSPQLQRMMEQSAMVSMIERVALDPNASIEKLERMLAMKERLDGQAREEQAREAKAAYFRAMAECQADLKVVVRNKKNDHTKSTYADLAALAEQADPVIHQHGFTTSFQPAGVAENGDLLIQWTVAHTGGHVESGSAAFPADKTGAQGNANKTPLQASGSTYSYGRRYLKLMLFDIATGDDNDGNAAKRKAETISADEFRELREMMERAGADDKFVQVYGVTDLHHLPAAMFGPARTVLAQRIAKKAQANA